MFSSLIVGRSGDSLSGRLLDKVFIIESVFGQYRVGTDDIAYIHFQNPPLQASDEIWLHSGDRLSGHVSTETKPNGPSISFQRTNGEKVEIPFDAIHTIIVNQAFDPTKGGLK